MPNVLRRYASGENRFERPSPNHDDETQAPVVLMVSGGADSTALLVLAATSTLDIDDGRGKARIARERLHVLHVNHQLRGIDAREDEEFVVELSQRYGIPCVVHHVDVEKLAHDAKREGKSADANVENVGREVRYAAAAELANTLSEQCGTPRSAARILTAHTANDRAETFFMNAIKGTGPAGLSSIPRRRNRIVRPLLDRTHEELCCLLRMRGIVWREDETNHDTRYLRAFVRHEVMPVVEQRNPRVVGSLAATCDILSDEDAYMTQVASRVYRDLLRRQAQGMVALDSDRLGATEVAIARRVVRSALLAVCPAARLEARHIASVLSLVAAGHGSVTMPMGVDARVEYGLLFIRQDADVSAHDAGWLEVPGLSERPSEPGRLMLPSGDALLARLVEVPAGSQAPDLARAHSKEWEGASVLLDAAACGLDVALGGLLWVDSAEAGDVFCPFGMHGQSKKLSDLLNEAKIPAADRAAVPIVRTSPRGHVIWVTGIRADERVRCLPSSKLLLELSFVTA